jgi:integrase
MGANCIVKLQTLVRDKDIINMDISEILRDIKLLFLPEEEFLKPHKERVTKELKFIETHFADEAEGKSQEEKQALFRKYSPVFKKVKSEADYQNALKKARAHYGVEQINSKQDIQSGLKFSDVAKMYSEEMVVGGNWTVKTRQENEAAYNLFVELQGDHSASAIQIKNITKFKTQLQKLPKNVRKLKSTKDIPLREIVESDHQLDTLSITSVNKNLRIISSLLGWASTNGHLSGGVNPAAGIGIKQKKDAREERLPFEPSALSQIFSTKIYRPDHKSLHSYYFWLPLLGLFSGARLNELCQLDISDIKEDGGIYFFDINDNGDKTLKNESAKRVIPIHSKLIEIGFLEYINEVKACGFDKVFPSLKKQRDGYGQAASKWFGRLKKKLDLEHPEKKNYHSFRHNTSDALKAAAVEESSAAQILGHKHPHITYGRYGSIHELKQLQSVVEKIQYDVPELESLTYGHSEDK